MLASNLDEMNGWQINTCLVYKKKGHIFQNKNKIPFFFFLIFRLISACGLTLPMFMHMLWQTHFVVN